MRGTFVGEPIPLSEDDLGALAELRGERPADLAEDEAALFDGSESVEAPAQVPARASPERKKGPLHGGGGLRSRRERPLEAT